MPSKIIGGISPAYGIVTGSSPYKAILGSYGRDIHDQKVDERKEEERIMKEKRDLEEARRKIERQSSYYGSSVRMSAGGRVGKKSIDGKAIRGMTKGRLV